LPGVSREWLTTQLRLTSNIGERGFTTTTTIQANLITGNRFNKKMSKVKCSRCKIQILLGKAIKYSKNKYGTQYYNCRECNRNRIRAYYATPNGRKNIRKAIIKSTKKFFYKQVARMRLNIAVKKGLVVRPDKCTNCGDGGRIECHHENYRKPLVCIWVCKPCHADIERS